MGTPPYVAPTGNMTVMSGEMTGVEGQPPVEKANKVWLPWVKHLLTMERIKEFLLQRMIQWELQ